MFNVHSTFRTQFSCPKNKTIITIIVTAKFGNWFHISRFNNSVPNFVQANTVNSKFDWQFGFSTLQRRMNGKKKTLKELSLSQKSTIIMSKNQPNAQSKPKRMYINSIRFSLFLFIFVGRMRERKRKNSVSSSCLSQPLYNYDSIHSGIQNCKCFFLCVL